MFHTLVSDLMVKYSTAGTSGFFKALEMLLLIRLGLQPLLESILIPHLGRELKMYILLFYFDNQ